MSIEQNKTKNRLCVKKKLEPRNTTSKRSSSLVGALQCTTERVSELDAMPSMSDIYMQIMQDKINKNI